MIQNSEFPVYKVEVLNRSLERVAVFSDEIERSQNSRVGFELLQNGNCGQFQFEVHDSFDLTKLDFNYFTKIYYKNVLKYTGIILKKPRKGGTSRLRTVSGFGLFDQLHNVTITKKYTNATIDEMVKDVIQNYVISETDIVYNASKIIDPSVTVKKLTFFGQSAKKVLDRLAELCSDYVFGVDEDKEFFFEPLDTSIQRKYYVGKDVKLFIPDEDSDKIVSELKIRAGKYFGQGYARVIREDVSAKATYGTKIKEILVPELSEPEDIETWKDRAFEKLTRTRFNPRLSIFSADEILKPKGVIQVVDTDGTEYGFPLLNSLAVIHNPSADVTLGLGYEYPTNIVDDLRSIDSKREEAEQKANSDRYSIQIDFIQESEDSNFDNVYLDEFDDFSGLEEYSEFDFMPYMAVGETPRFFTKDSLDRLYLTSQVVGSSGNIHRFDGMTGAGHTYFPTASSDASDGPGGIAVGSDFKIFVIERPGSGDRIFRYNDMQGAGETWYTVNIGATLNLNRLRLKIYNDYLYFGHLRFTGANFWYGLGRLNGTTMVGHTYFEGVQDAAPQFEPAFTEVGSGGAGSTYIYYMKLFASTYQLKRGNDITVQNDGITIYNTADLNTISLARVSPGTTGLVYSQPTVPSGDSPRVCKYGLTIDNTLSFPNINTPRDVYNDDLDYLYVHDFGQNKILRGPLKIDFKSKAITSDLEESPLISSRILTGDSKDDVMIHANFVGRIRLAVSRDDGVTFTAGVAGLSLDISGQPAGSCYRLRAIMEKDTILSGWGLSL